MIGFLKGWNFMGGGKCGFFIDNSFDFYNFDV